jgi:hypothetical protein
MLITFVLLVILPNVLRTMLNPSMASALILVMALVVIVYQTTTVLVVSFALALKRSQGYVWVHARGDDSQGSVLT